MPDYKKEGIETARVGIVMPKETRGRLESAAKAKGWSLSQTATMAIQEWLDRLEGKASSSTNSEKIA
jgi:hypothetical protein